MIKKPRIAIVGAGARGTAYAQLAVEDGRAEISAVAEPQTDRREAFVRRYNLADTAAFTSWQDLANSPRGADAVVISTQDRMHTEPAIAFANQKYDILLEKPIAPTEAEVADIVRAAEANDVLLAVCHVMRYSTYTRKLKELLAAEAIGQIVSIEHLEPIGWWHFAHSYVRGNWAVERDSNSMLMAKSCHDLDWLYYLVGQPVAAVSSFGGLFHFRPEHRPKGAKSRCVDCPLQSTCPYSATTIYRRFLGNPTYEVWPLGVLAREVTPASIDRALREGPYGLCVFNGRNDVADHQVVNLEFAGGATASFTATAFAELDFRKSRIFGTNGCIEGDGRNLLVHDFATDTKRTIEAAGEGNASAADGHGGADRGLVQAFLAAVETRDSSLLLSGPRESLRTHQIVWAAERARHSGQVVRLDLD